MNLSVISYGGGVQSTAMMVLAAQGELAVDAMLFANVGNDSERKATLNYVRDVAIPFADADRRSGEPRSLMGHSPCCPSPTSALWTSDEGKRNGGTTH